MKICLVLLFTTLATISAFGQDSAKASMSPTEVTGGQNLTVTVTVNKGVPVQNSYINITLAPKDPKDKTQPIIFNINPQGNDSLVYQGSIQLSPNAKGAWYVQQAVFHLPVAGETSLQIDHPGFTVKPVELVLPTTGSIRLSAN